jgi:hypothetical protein
MRQISVPEVPRLKSDSWRLEKDAFLFPQLSDVIRPALGTRIQVHKTKDVTDE